MSALEVVVSAACVLSSLQSEVTAGEQLWEEQSTLTVTSEGGCDRVHFVVPPGTSLIGRKARLHYDLGRARVEEDHWDAEPADLAGDRVYTLYIPELQRGGVVEISLQATQSAVTPWRWRPEPFDYAEVKVPKDRQVTAFGEVRQDGRRWWTTDAEGAEVRVHWGDPAAPPLLPLPATDSPPLDALAALADMSTLLLLPRGVDGPSPMAGPTAVRRGAVDDRGFARTLVAMTAGGPDKVLHGAWLAEPTAEGVLDTIDEEVALWVHDDRVEVLRHPAQRVRGGQVWTAEGIYTLPAPDKPQVHDPFEAATRDRPRLTHQTLSIFDIPKGDPRTRLYPGGGSRRLVRRAIGFPVDGRARAYALELPDAVGDIALSTDPPNAVEPLWTMRLRDGDGVLVVGPTPYPFTILAEWVEQDPPACQVVQADPWHRTGVEAPQGEIVWDTGDSWHLASWRGKPVLPGIDRLIAGLDHRYDAYAMPEPGLPVRWKNASKSWDLPGQLRDVLFERAVPGELPQRVGWPRPLYKARASGVVTDLEAALILRLYLVQSGMPTTWAMVRPAWEGEGRPTCPVAYTEALIRVDWEGASRWLDPGCTVCAPFELRPHLEGAAAIGPDVEETPPPTAGEWTVEVLPETVRWHLEGPAALRLREWVARVPADQRNDRLASRMAGPGATLLEHEGISAAGEPITLVASRPDGAFQGEDPLALPEAMPEGFTWFDWLGERRFIRPGEAQPFDLQVKGAHWRRVVTEGTVTETLRLTSRRIEADAVQRLEERP